jgi:hypothetical protein
MKVGFNCKKAPSFWGQFGGEKNGENGLLKWYLSGPKF